MEKKVLLAHSQAAQDRLRKPRFELQWDVHLQTRRVLFMGEAIASGLQHHDPRVLQLHWAVSEPLSEGGYPKR